MKRIHRILLLFAAAGLVLTSCSKEMSKEGDAPQGTPCEYAPYTNGSSFSFLNISQAGDTQRYTLTVSGDTTINGVTYKKVGDDNVFTCSSCKDGIYTQIASLTFQTYKADDLQLTYLKDNVAPGASWSDTITVKDGANTTTGILQHTVTGKGITKRVLNKDFLDVIVVRTDAFALLSGNTVPAGNVSTSYYAKGIGLVEADQPQDTIKLVDYILKP
ncbi:MAG TPA: hypothetical protein VM802_13680 [Chitinophaga sp.]|uniref:hypothetical protein n=1 Tax=Chitinophaga sp. TaxID=1869181 RepID=UPI002C8D5E8B|nr:hypothetical protein [Chitinophaga sp.]HVI45920.1 hypothetical protein [Chitinophaga sp.]